MIKCVRENNNLKMLTFCEPHDVLWDLSGNTVKKLIHHPFTDGSLNSNMKSVLINLTNGQGSYNPVIYNGREYCYVQTKQFDQFNAAFLSSN